ncbi:EGF-like domain-containing protein 1 [Gigantopelta aegis]|uniref:EGF-like domain-containing protein 1 n=1 Tax=Gigantopelta aegis TaxID=1735272 RepID=UPI001B88A13C|nr:EGF-like domain-containing protein 1 [Gigantopelta aegis]
MFRFVLLSIVVISTVHGQFPSLMFDCLNRDDQKCPTPASCDATKKKCNEGTCPNGKFGYACHLDFDVAYRPICLVGCQNGGSCLQDSSCGCTPDYTGTLCETPRIALTCGGPSPPVATSTIGINVSGIIGFDKANGQVIVEGAAKIYDIDDTACFGKAGEATLTVTNDYDDSVKSRACNKATLDEGTGIYTRKFIIRFEAGTTSPNTDFRVTAACGPAGSTVTVTSTTIHHDFLTTALQNIDKSNTVAGAAVTAKLEVGGGLLDTTLNYGLATTIDVTLTLDNSGVFKTIRLEKFTIENGGTSLKSMVLVDNGCPTALEKVVVKTSAAREVDNIVTLQTVPVIMDGTAENIYKFVVRACTGSQAHACPEITDCTAGGGTRQKRAEDNDLATLGVGFNVRDDMQRNMKNLRDEMRNQKECTLTTEITASLVAMAVAILLLLVLVIVLSVRAILAHRRDVTVYQHHQMDSSSTTSLPRKVNANF